MRKTALVAALLMITAVGFSQIGNTHNLYYLKADTILYPLIVYSTNGEIVLKITGDKKIHVYDSMKAIERLIEEFTIGKKTLIHKPDTVLVPIYLIDITDTIAVNTIMYKEKANSNRIYTTKGFALLRGFKTLANGKPQWVDKPKLIGALDEKKKVIKNLIQIL